MTAMTQTTTWMMKTRINALILLAAGSSSRMGGGIKKEYLPLCGGTVLSQAAAAFIDALEFSFVIVTIQNKKNPEELKAVEESCKKAYFAGHEELKAVPVYFLPGGESRQESVKKALEKAAELSENPSQTLAFIHDGARPFVSGGIIRECGEAALKYGAALPGLQPVDTQKEIDSEGFICRHLNRSKLTAVQTPQVFALEPLLEAHRKAACDGKPYTDDSEIWDEYAAGKKIDGFECRRTFVVKGSPENKKITYIADADFSKTGENLESQKGKEMKIHTGLGWDRHLLSAGRKLILGGVEIPSEKGELGHSDGDVLLHAVTDALLGAAGLGDIGSYFPPEEAKWKGADSKVLLAKCWGDVQAAGWKLVNLDCVIALEKPKFLPFRENVRESIAGILGVSKEDIFVKAKTGEKLGDVGQGNCIEATAVCLLEREG